MIPRVVGHCVEPFDEFVGVVLDLLKRDAALRGVGDQREDGEVAAARLGLVEDAIEPAVVGRTSGDVSFLLPIVHDAALVPLRPFLFRLGNRGSAAGREGPAQLVRDLITPDSAVINQIVEAHARRLGLAVRCVHERQGLVFAARFVVDAVAVQAGGCPGHAKPLVNALVLDFLVGSEVGPNDLGEPPLEQLQEGNQTRDHRHGTLEKVVEMQAAPAHDEIGRLRQ